MNIDMNIGATNNGVSLYEYTIECAMASVSLNHFVAVDASCYQGDIQREQAIGVIGNLKCGKMSAIDGIMAEIHRRNVT